MQSRAGLIRSKFIIHVCLRINVSCIGFFRNGIGIGFNLRIQRDDILSYCITCRDIGTTSKGIIDNALHADNLILGCNIVWETISLAPTVA